MTPAELTARGVRVKPLDPRPLVWIDAASYSPWFYCRTEVGEYRWGWDFRSEGAWASRDGVALAASQFPDGKAAIAAAQADYDMRRNDANEARICAALTTGENDD